MWASRKTRSFISSVLLHRHTRSTLFTVKTSSYTVEGVTLPQKSEPLTLEKSSWVEKLLAAQMQLTVLGGVAWQKDDLARGARRGGGDVGSLTFAEWAPRRLLSARLMQVRGYSWTHELWAAPRTFALWKVSFVCFQTVKLTRFDSLLCNFIF